MSDEEICGETWGDWVCVLPPGHEGGHDIELPGDAMPILPQYGPPPDDDEQPEGLAELLRSIEAAGGVVMAIGRQTEDHPVVAEMIQTVRVLPMLFMECKGLAESLAAEPDEGIQQEMALNLSRYTNATLNSAMTDLFHQIGQYLGPLPVPGDPDNLEVSAQTFMNLADHSDIAMQLERELALHCDDQVHKDMADIAKAQREILRGLSDLYSAHEHHFLTLGLKEVYNSEDPEPHDLHGDPSEPEHD